MRPKLGITLFQCVEFSGSEWREFCERRQVQLEAQLDHFKKLDFSKANTTNINSSYYRIISTRIQSPLSCEVELFYLDYQVASEHKKI